MVSLFASVNSSQGFVSRFDQIQNEEEGCRKIYIKGGSGMGKSTILKRIAARAEEEGFDCEIFHCSSDRNSLDGVNIPCLKTAVIDATYPHIYDPLFLGISGEIFDTSRCFDGEKVRANEKNIRFFAAKKKKYFEMGYNYLKAARLMLKNAENEYRDFMDTRGINIESKKIINRLFMNIRPAREGKMRSLFLSAICPDGIVNYADNVFYGKNVISVKGKYGTEIFMKKIAEAAMSVGMDITVFCCPTEPFTKYEHILIPEINTAFTTFNYYHYQKGREMIDLDEYLKRDVDLSDINHSDTAEKLIENAIGCFAGAKSSHGFLESYYTPAMDFEKLDRMAKQMEDSIFESGGM